MVQWKVPCSVPHCIPRLERYRTRSGGRSSAESSAFSGVNSGDGSSGTSVGATTTVGPSREVAPSPLSTKSDLRLRPVHRASTGRLQDGEATLHDDRPLDRGPAAVVWPSTAGSASSFRRTIIWTTTFEKYDSERDTPRGSSRVMLEFFVESKSGGRCPVRGADEGRSPRAPRSVPDRLRRVHVHGRRS